MQALSPDGHEMRAPGDENDGSAHLSQPAAKVSAHATGAHDGYPHGSILVDRYCAPIRYIVSRVKVEPVTLRGTVVRLEPLTMDHLPALSRAGLEPELWRWIPTPVTTSDEMRAYVLTALDEQRRGVSLPFAIIGQPSDEVIGSTRYANIDANHRRLEIGWTWLTQSHQRTGANTEAKLLLLAHAFESLGAIRVEFKTDALNDKSREALLRIGAVEEGTFRKHVVTASGRVRDTVYFSIINTEWPATKARLTGLLR
jgi:RimJ/RimL family protein N-acetyltransferase